jgi:hypothetical protein
MIWLHLSTFVAEEAHLTSASSRTNSSLEEEKSFDLITRNKKT